MGDEISTCQFSEEDFEVFGRRLREENRLLMEWFERDYFETTQGMCGLELEAWLVDKQYHPSPVNEEFLKRVNDHLVVPELSRFNFEINSTPHPLQGKLLSALAQELLDLWKTCETRANEIGANILAIGILPTIQNEMLSMKNMSSLRRYFALNQQIFKLRGEKPMEIKIEGKDTLHLEHKDVMLEAAATSLQIHLQVNPVNAIRYYNLAHILSAPMVAVAANSPYLFGKDLWDETRIPTFEQSVSIACFRDCRGESVGRVTFGTGYGRDSIIEPFLENLNGFPVLLPMVFDDDPAWLSHLRLHNGTIWRWNRPLIGLSPEGKPHIRIEHRVAAAGPTVYDIIGNVAFFIGLTHYFIKQKPRLDKQIPFETAKRNFYQAAKFGMDANITWRNGKTVPLHSLLTESLLPAARRGLQEADLAPEDIACFLDGIIAPRLRTRRNGAAWQRSFIAAHGFDFGAMTHAYFENQKKNHPVHEWTV